MSPLIPLIVLFVLPARSAELKSVPPLIEPVSSAQPMTTAAPVLTQLLLDMGTLRAVDEVPILPPSALALPDAFSSLQKALDASSRAPAAAQQTDALRRVELAQQVLGRFDPNEFSKLPPAQQDAALGGLWEGWKSRGLVEDPGADADPGAALDRMLVAGVEDRALTSANKSAFLGVGVLGYPLEDSLWLQRTRIGDALDENSLRYPKGQRWHTDDHTPEFLGTTPEAQSLVDAWGAATDYGKQLVEAVKSGAKTLPKGAAASPAAAAAFAAVARELKANKDDAALDYLSGQDPTFSAFLLDARKPGYYLYNGDQSIVARIMSTKAAAALGARRIDKKDGDRVVASTYFYRPARVAARLVETGKRKVEPYDDDARRRLAEYGARMAPLVSRLGR